MSLVAYESSGDSDSEETATPAAPRGKSGTGGLFSLLPAPKKFGSAAAHQGPSRETRSHPSAGDGRDPPSSKTGLLAGLPKARKRSEPVKISVPQIRRQDSDSDDDEPVQKKPQQKATESGLFALLPQPKNLSVKETARLLIPHTLTKRPEPKGAKPGAPAQGLLGASASPSAIKAAAKSAALQKAKQIAADDHDNDEDITPQNYFSLGDSSPSVPAVAPSIDPEPVAAAESPAVADDDSDTPGQSDAPLDFGGSPEAAGAWSGQYSQCNPPVAAPETFPPEYYNESYYPTPDPALSEESEEPGQSAMFDEEGFMRLQGKRNRGKEEVKFLEIKGDDQLSDNKQWMTKNISEEKQTRQSFSKKKGEQPTGQQRRKHQITYLIHQAKERELELKNSWADNKLTRRQTQAKYGF